MAIYFKQLLSLSKTRCLMNVMIKWPNIARIKVFRVYSSTIPEFKTLDVHKLLYRKKFEGLHKMSSVDYSSAAKIQDIQFEDLNYQLKNNKVILIDVRESDELIKDGRIPGSVNIPLGDVEKAFAMVPEKFQNQYGISLPNKNESQLIFSCRSGRRAGIAVEKIQKLGYSKVKCYLGSFQDWVAKGGEIVKC